MKNPDLQYIDTETLRREVEYRRREEELNSYIQVDNENIIKWKDFINKKDAIKALAQTLPMPDVRLNKVANCFAIGGMIAFGKSTLAKALQERFKEYSRYVEELDETDEFTMMLLRKMYEREGEIYSSTFQYYFVQSRFARYKDMLKEYKDKTIFFDRTIFEDYIFARENIKDPVSFDYYTAMYNAVCTELRYEVGVPQYYLILDADWETFKERIYKRNRREEIDNFEKNEEYFKHLLNNYTPWLKGICNKIGIPYLVVDAKLSTEEQVEYIVNTLGLKEPEKENK